MISNRRHREGLRLRLSSSQSTVKSLFETTIIFLLNQNHPREFPVGTLGYIVRQKTIRTATTRLVLLVLVVVERCLSHLFGESFCVRLGFARDCRKTLLRLLRGNTFGLQQLIEIVLGHPTTVHRGFLADDSTSQPSNLASSVTPSSQVLLWYTSRRLALVPYSNEPDI